MRGYGIRTYLKKVTGFSAAYAEQQVAACTVAHRHRTLRGDVAATVTAVEASVQEHGGTAGLDTAGIVVKSDGWFGYEDATVTVVLDGATAFTVSGSDPTDGYAVRFDSVSGTTTTGLQEAILSSTGPIPAPGRHPAWCASAAPARSPLRGPGHVHGTGIPGAAHPFDLRGGAAMADNENTITVVGRIGQEPELHTTTGGREVLNFDVATNERRRAADGTWSDGPTSWFKVAAWNQLGRNAQLSFHRGQRVVVHGVLRVTEFQLQSGGRSRSVELTATALGHDLTWGTSTFADAGRAVVQQQQQQPVQPAQDRDPEREPQPALATVPAGPVADWSSSLALDETPF